ncbi:MAG: hypothetical protein IPM91_20140 [Bacteroidetes bacterium]|nr:hypothetical protein [Bacteroidota bacterium]
MELFCTPEKHPLRLDAVKERKSLSNVTLGLQATGQPLKWLRFNISVLMDKMKKEETGLLDASFVFQL